MTEEEIIHFVGGLPGVITVTASEADGSPESAWGDSFFFYDPDGSTQPDNRFPFATIVVSDYEGFDTSSKLNRPGVFRLNINVGRTAFQELIGYSPAAHAQHSEEFDYAALDRLIPHPAYATQAWVSILNPEQSGSKARALLEQAHARAAARHRPRH
ncbi:MAG: DUF6194 family protein [Nakamurella sp.]